MDRYRCLDPQCIPEYMWTCEKCGWHFLADQQCRSCPGRGPGGKGVKGDQGDKRKKGAGQNWHADAGTKKAKPPKGKGKKGTNQN